jgi:hypothetical protein
MSHTRRTVRWILLFLVGMGALANASWAVHSATTPHTHVLTENSLPPGP